MAGLAWAHLRYLWKYSLDTGPMQLSGALSIDINFDVNWFDISWFSEQGFGEGQ